MNDRPTRFFYSGEMSQTKVNWRLTLSLSKSLVFPAILVSLIGCSTQTQLQPSELLVEPSQVSYVPGELNEESVYELLTAEIAGQRRDFERAQVLFEKQAALNQNTELAERATRLAQFLRDSDRVQRSASIWQEIAPDSDEPAQIMINILLHQGRIEDALEIIEAEDELSTETLLIIDSQIPRFNDQQSERLLENIEQRTRVRNKRLDLILIQSKILKHLDRIDDALVQLDSGLSIEPTQAELVVEKAQILATTKNQPRDALKLVELSLRDNPTHRQLRALQIQQLLKIDPARVEKTVRLAVNQSKNDPQLIYYYGLLLIENEQLELSEQLFSDLLKSDPNATDLYLYLGIIAASRGETEAALDVFSKVEKGDSLINAVSRSLELLDAQTEKERAAILISNALSKDLERTEDLNVLYTQWLNRNGFTEEGIAYITEELEKDPDSTRYLYIRAMISDSIDPDAMLADLEKAYRLENSSATIQNALGYTLLEYSDQYQRAYELIKLAFAQTPEDSAVIDSMGWALHKLGRDQEALPYLEQAYETFSDPEVGSHLIIVLSILGERDRAQQIYDELIKKDPESKKLREALEWLQTP